jgi:hypothetical protein
MSDATVETTVVEATKKTPVRKDLGDGRFVEKKDFKGNLEGFSYYALQFKSLKAAEDHFSKGDKKGDEVLLGFLNSSVAYAMRAKAQNKIPNEQDARAKQIERGESLVITEEDAAAYMPGDRDITSLSGLQKLVSEKKKQFKEAKEGGDTATCESLKAEIIELSRKIETLVLADLE